MSHAHGSEGKQYFLLGDLDFLRLRLPEDMRQPPHSPFPYISRNVAASRSICPRSVSPASDGSDAGDRSVHYLSRR